MHKIKSLPEAAFAYASSNIWSEYSASSCGRIVPVTPPQLTHVGDLFPPVAVQADTERYAERRKTLVPFSKKEQKLADKELYERLNGLGRAIKHPGARVHRAYETVVKINDFLDDTERRLEILQAVYDSTRNSHQSPEDIQNNIDVVELLVDCMQAQEDSYLGYLGPKEEKVIDREERKKQKIDYIKNVDGYGVLFLCHSASNILESRRNYWSIELATALTHPVIPELDGAIGSFDDSRDQETETLAQMLK